MGLWRLKRFFIVKWLENTGSRMFQTNKRNSFLLLTVDTPFHGMVNSSYCNLKCPGDLLSCGGFYYYNVYTALALTPKDINFQITVVSLIRWKLLARIRWLRIVRLDLFFMLSKIMWFNSIKFAAQILFEQILSSF